MKQVLIRNNCFRLNFIPIPCLFLRSSYTFGLSFFPNDSYYIVYIYKVYLMTVKEILHIFKRTSK